MLRKISIIILTLLIFQLSGCYEKRDKLTIAVTILPEKAFVEAVVKDKADIEVIVPQGAKPDNYEPSSKQIIKISKSAVFFKIGVPVESTNLINSLTELKSVDLSLEVQKNYDDLTFSENQRDPHIWLSIKRVKIMINKICEVMSEIDSENSSFYLENAESYIKELDLLYNESENYFNNKTSRLFLTFHPAFNYLAQDFNLEMFALEEEGKEETPLRKQKFIDKAVDNNISVIFSQPERDGSQDIWVKEQLNAEIIILNPLDENYIQNFRQMTKAIADSMI